MAGLLKRGDTPVMSEKPAMSEPENTGGEQPNVSEEEQAQYDQFVTNGMQMLYDEKAMPRVLESLSGDGNPVEGLANALVTLVMRMEDSAEQAGEKISGDVMFHGGTELLEQMADMSEKAGVHKFSKKEMEEALYQALDIYRNTRQQQGRLPEDQLGADMEQIVAADQAGNLESILPGLSQFAGSEKTNQRGNA